MVMMVMMKVVKNVSMLEIDVWSSEEFIFIFILFLFFLKKKKVAIL